MHEILATVSASTALWYALKSLPEFMHGFAYFFGFLFACWAMDQYF